MMAPNTLSKIDALLWPASGPDLVDLSGQLELRQSVYEYTQFGPSSSYVWHPMSAIARMPDGSQKAHLIDIIDAELNDATEAAALRRFMASAGHIARGIDALKAKATEQGFLWPELWNLVACDLWTFLECGFQPSQVLNSETLDICDQSSDEIMELAFQAINW